MSITTKCAVQSIFVETNTVAPVHPGCLDNVQCTNLLKWETICVDSFCFRKQEKVFSRVWTYLRGSSKSVVEPTSATARSRVKEPLTAKDNWTRYEEGCLVTDPSSWQRPEEPLWKMHICTHNWMPYWLCIDLLFSPIRRESACEISYVMTWGKNVLQMFRQFLTIRVRHQGTTL